MVHHLKDLLVLKGFLHVVHKVQEVVRELQIQVLRVRQVRHLQVVVVTKVR